jgi:hypothetical protein
MATAPRTSGSPRLRRLVREAAERAEAAQERCELCGEVIPAEHRHLVDLESGELMCACRACSLLFDRPAAGGGHFRLVPDRRRRLDGFQLDDARWESLRLPVDMAFFFHSTRAGRVMALYPSPAGATESLLELQTWEAVVAANPVLEEMAPDVEALLVNRSRGAREHWLVPLDACYELVALIRTRWRGLTGGAEVWREIQRWFEELDRRATPARGRPTQEVP